MRQGRALSRGNNGRQMTWLLGPGFAGGVFHFGGHLGFADTRANGFQRPVERLAPRSTADRRQAISSSSFTMRACSTRAGASRRRKLEGRIPASRDRVATVMCSPSIPSFEGSSTAFLRRCADSQAAAAASGPWRAITICAVRTSARACSVYRPSVIEHAFRSGEKQGAGAAGESAEIAKVGRMSDQQSVQAMGGKRILQTLLAASMVHPRSLATAWRGGHG